MDFASPIPYYIIAMLPTLLERDNGQLMGINGNTVVFYLFLIMFNNRSIKGKYFDIFLCLWLVGCNIFLWKIVGSARGK